MSNNNKLIYKAVVRGNCTICGKPIDCDSIFTCRSCQEKMEHIKGETHGKKEERTASVR